jgi:hypothetical protein
MIAWEAAAGPTTVHRQGSRSARPAPPACGLDCAPLARLFAAMRSWLAGSDCAHGVEKRVASHARRRFKRKNGGFWSAQFCTELARRRG